jgi:hypothetical protein
MIWSYGQQREQLKAIAVRDVMLTEVRRKEDETGA